MYCEYNTQKLSGYKSQLIINFCPEVTKGILPKGKTNAVVSFNQRKGETNIAEVLLISN